MNGVMLAAADARPLPAEGTDRLVKNLVRVTAAAGAVSVVGYFIAGPKQFMFSYLTAYMFTLTLALGALFWVMIHHLSDAGWSVTIRRGFENLTRAIPIWAVLFLPVLVHLGTAYDWASADHRAKMERPPASPDETEEQKNWRSKTFYLNVPFFLARVVLYFGVWSLLAWRFRALSLQQDETGEAHLSRRMRGLAGPGILLLALTATFAAFDWMMGLDWRWYSTIYGVTFWASSILNSMVLMALVALTLRSFGYLRQSVTAEHCHDMGKLIFGFVIFWAYVNFSQYFLYWYANIPEETSFFRRRHEGAWFWVSVALCFGHFAIPFFLLLGRPSKRNPFVLGLAVVWLLAFHYVEMYWQIMPAMTQREQSVEALDLHPHWLDATTLVAFAGGLTLVLLHGLRKYPLVPVRDPRLSECLTHEVY